MDVVVVEGQDQQLQVGWQVGRLAVPRAGKQRRGFSGCRLGVVFGSAPPVELASFDLAAEAADTTEAKSHHRISRSAFTEYGQ
jgi:hypothetical protein